MQMHSIGQDVAKMNMTYMSRNSMMQMHSVGQDVSWSGYIEKFHDADAFSWSGCGQNEHDIR